MSRIIQEGAMYSRKALCFALLIGSVTIAIASCRQEVSSSASGAAANAVIGTYVARDSGTTLGKPWSYSGVLVLDSTSHFGAAFSSSGSIHIESGPPNAGIRGTYRVLVSRRHRHGQYVSTTRVELQPNDEDQRHTLDVRGDSLVFTGPWWFSAGLSALGIPDPVFLRLPDSAVASATAAPKLAAGNIASSTPPGSTSRGATRRHTTKPR